MASIQERAGGRVTLNENILIDPTNSSTTQLLAKHGSVTPLKTQFTFLSHVDVVMRLLNIGTFKLETYNDEGAIPPYVILSHRWGDQEVLFEDLQELPHDQEIRDLCRNFKGLEQCFNSLQSQRHNEEHALRETQHIHVQQGNPATLQHSAEQGRDDEKDVNLLNSRLHRAKSKEKSWKKINGCCKEARSFGFSHIWIDTCCINKDSSSELSESVNSMFSWYRNSSLCIAYLSDVSSKNGINEFDRSKWFSRGWTLQELLAPDEVWFYNEDWEFLGLRSALVSKIASITVINKVVLERKNQAKISSFSVAARFSWAAGRVTTRAEDKAYSLLGLFGVNMPTIYGEGEKAAFFRLQVEIFKALPDHSIFAWNCPFDERDVNSNHEIDMFAPRVELFVGAGSIVSSPYHSNTHIPQDLLTIKPTPAYSRFSHGICVQLLLGPMEFGSSHSFFRACLACKIRGNDKVITIDLREDEPGHFVRLRGDIFEVNPSAFDDRDWSMRDVYLSHPSLNLGLSWHRSISQRAFKTTRLKDKQLLDSGWKRTRCSWNLSMTSFLHTGESFLQLERRSDYVWDLSEAITESGEFDLPEYSRTGALMYQHRNTKAKFAVAFNFAYMTIEAAIVDHFGWSMRPSSIYPPSVDMKNFWKDLSVGVISKPLGNGLHVFVSSNHSATGTLQLNMGLKSIALLGLNIDDRTEEDNYVSSPIRIYISEY